MFRLRLRRKLKEKKALDERRVDEIVKQQLSAYIKHEDLQTYLTEIERDKRKKQVWNSMSAHKKVKVLRYVLAKKGATHGKK